MEVCSISPENFCKEYLRLHRTCWHIDSMKGPTNFPRKIRIIRESFSWFSCLVASMSDFHHNVFKLSFPLCRWTYVKLIAYGKTNWGRDFPSALEDSAVVKTPMSPAFYYALSPLLREVFRWRWTHYESVFSPCDSNTPHLGTPARHLEIPMDLNTMRLPNWVNNVRYLATGMVMLPPTFLVTGKVIQSSVAPQAWEGGWSQILQILPPPHTCVCGCSQISAGSHTSTRQTPATVTTTGSHASTSVSASMMCPASRLCSLKEQ